MSEKCLIVIKMNVDDFISTFSCIQIVSHKKAKKLKKYIDGNRDKTYECLSRAGFGEIPFRDIDITMTQDEETITAYKKMKQFTNNISNFEFGFFYDEIFDRLD